MERLIKKDKDGNNCADDINNVFDRLEKFENLFEFITMQQSLPAELDNLRRSGEIKSYRYREMFGHKLMNDSFITLLKRFKLL
ncbi:MAG: hypothetical protein ACYCWE_13355 [Eubacteriales bacterium]